MPADYFYCPDNFFFFFSDLDSPKKNNDCYFYYYSTCAKGDTCTFRHEPSALGCETMCTYWKEGKCLNIHCNFRHMELRKNRKVIPCYWESQPIGCLKAHCPFLHQNPRPTLGSSERSNLSAGSSMTNNMMNQQTERKVTAVDSLVVNFEEESDNESGPTFSPIKHNSRIVKVKTMEEIRLEEIQAESAAYYSCYENEPHFQRTISNQSSGDEMRQRIVHRMIVNNSNLMPDRKITVPMSNTSTQRKRLSNDDLANILGDESLRKKPKIVYQNEDGNFQVILNKRSKNNEISITIDDNLDNKRVVKQRKPIDQTNVDNIKIKTLAEIRAERNAKKDEYSISQQEKEEAEVTSTSEENYVSQDILNKEKVKIKIRRKLPISEPDPVSTYRNENKKTVMPRNDQVETLSEDKLLEDVFEDDFDDDDDFDITLKAEEDLLNEVDD